MLLIDKDLIIKKSAHSRWSVLVIDDPASFFFLFLRRLQKLFIGFCSIINWAFMSKNAKETILLPIVDEQKVCFKNPIIDFNI